MESEFNTSAARCLIEQIENTQGLLRNVQRVVQKLDEPPIARVVLQFFFGGAPNSYDTFSISNKAIMRGLAVDERERLELSLKRFTRELGELVDEVGCGK
jgi:hypothetical protein